MGARISVAALLKSVLAALAAIIVVLLALGTWEAWQRQVAASRMAEIADASADIFRGLDRMRLDRSRTARLLGAADPAEPADAKSLTDIQNDEVAALRSAYVTLQRIDFPDRATVLPKVQQLIETLPRLHDEARAAFAKPKTARRADLAKEFDTTASAGIGFLDDLGDDLAAAVRGGDAFIDQMMIVKQLAWNTRKALGDAGAILAQRLAAGRTDDETFRRYMRIVGSVPAVWDGVEAAAAGGPQSRELKQAMDAAKAAVLGAEYTGVRDRAMEALLKGEKPEITAPQWSQFNTPRQDTVVAAAVVALDRVIARAAELKTAATRDLVVNGLLLAATLLLAVGSIVAVQRRVIVPLVTIRDAMLRLAGGDLAVDTPYAERGDEIGGLASALVTFRQNAQEKERIEAEQRQARDAREARAAAVEHAIRDFEAEISTLLKSVLDASGVLTGTAEEMTEIAVGSTRKAAEVAAASQQASANVQTVAAASEELARSIEEIGLQVTTSQTIARQAVGEAETTNTTVNGLVEASSRVGEIVGLINSIASQTNLLALNATIEAARAGEAGKGFAVVAQEVKNLAAQTANATEQISQQIQSMQAISTEAAQAIKGIGSTIVRIDEIATGIAAAVEEQNAATREIARNVEQAARGTEAVHGNIAEVTAAADQTGGAAHRVLGASADVSGQAEAIRSRVAGFLAGIRAA